MFSERTQCSKYQDAAHILLQTRMAQSLEEEQPVEKPPSISLFRNTAYIYREGHTQTHIHMTTLIYVPEQWQYVVWVLLIP